MITSKLDDCLAAYTDQFQYALDNRLMLTWYPHRVLLKAARGSMLELGVGHGYTMQIFAEHFRRYVVIEASEEVIKNAFTLREVADNKVDIHQGFFETYQTDEKFDNINMGFVLEHVDDPVAILRHFKPLLAPGGKVFISVPNGEALNRRYGHAAGMLPDMLQLSDADRLLGHQRVFTVASMRACVESEGYAIHSIEGLFLKPITTEQIKTLNLSEAILKSMMTVGIDYPELCVGMLLECSPA